MSKMNQTHEGKHRGFYSVSSFVCMEISTKTPLHILDDIKKKQPTLQNIEKLNGTQKMFLRDYEQNESHLRSESQRILLCFQ